MNICYYSLSFLSVCPWEQVGRASFMHGCSLHPANQPRAQRLAPSVCSRSVDRIEIILRGVREAPAILAGVGLTTVINKPCNFYSTASPSPASPSFFSCRFLTNPSFQEREAELFWGRARGGVRVGTTSRCHSKETIGSKRQAGELSTPCFPA